MIVEELVTMLGFKVKGVGDLDKARKSYDALVKSIRAGSRALAADVGRATRLFEVQGGAIRKNQRTVEALTRTTSRLGSSVRAATLNVTGLSRGYDAAGRSARGARVELAKADLAARRSRRAGLLGSTSLGTGRVGRKPGRRGVDNLPPRGPGLTPGASPRPQQVGRRPAKRREIPVNSETVGPVAGAIGAASAVGAYKEAAAYDRRLTLIGITAKATAAEVDGARKSVAAISKETAVSRDSVVGGLESLVAAGRDMKDSLEFLPSVTRTAATAGAEVTDIANTADAVGSNFGIAGKQMQTAFDIMKEGGEAGKFELKDMARYLPSLAPAASAIGFKGEKGLTDLIAMLQTMRRGAGTAEEAVASMNNILTKMESDKTTKGFKELGVDSEAAFAKARKEGRNLVEVFDDLLQKALKGDSSKLGKIIDDQEFKRGALALMQYRGEWQKMSSTLQRTAPGSVARSLPLVTTDSQASIQRTTDSVKTLYSELARFADKDGLPKGLEEAATEFNSLATAIERISAAYKQGGTKAAFDQIFGDAKKGRAENQKEMLEGRAKQEAGRIAELETARDVHRKKLEAEGRPAAEVADAMKIREAEIAKARKRAGVVEKARTEAVVPDKTPLRMGADPTAPIQGKPGAVSSGVEGFQKAFPLDLNPPKPLKGPSPLPPRRPSDLPRGIDSIDDVLGPAPKIKPEVDTADIEKAKSTATDAGEVMKTSLSGAYHPTVDISSITAAITAAQTLKSTLASAGTTVSATVKAAAVTPAGRAVAAAGRPTAPSAPAGPVTAALRRDMAPSVQVAKMGRAQQLARAGGNTTNNGGPVTVQVAQTNASPSEIGRQVADQTSRRQARDWSVTAPSSASA